MNWDYIESFFVEKVRELLDTGMNTLSKFGDALKAVFTEVTNWITNLFN